MANKNAIIYNFRTYINLSLIFPHTVPSKIYVHNLNHIKKKFASPMLLKKPHMKRLAQHYKSTLGHLLKFHFSTAFINQRFHQLIYKLA